MAATTTNVVQHLLDLLGWKHATTGKKSVDFSDTMQVLGVAFHLQNFWNKQVTVANRPSRIQRILEMLASCAAKGTVSAPEAATMHGLLNYAGGLWLDAGNLPPDSLQVCSQVRQIQSSYHACAMIHESLIECDHEKFTS